MAAAATAGPPPQGYPHPHAQHPHRPPQLGPFNSERKHSEPERWICIYPAYFNSNKSRREGRLLPKSHCVPNPTYLEIREVLATADQGWTPIVENKQYPREKSREIEFRGRIRVQFRKEDGSLFAEKFDSRESIMRYLGEKIPQLKSRTSQRQGQSQEPQQQQGNKKGKKKK